MAAARAASTPARKSGIHGGPESLVGAVAGLGDGVGGAGATELGAVAAGAGETVKSVSRLAVVCEFAIVPSRQTCDPIVAPDAMTWLKGAGLFVLEPGRIPPEEAA